MVFGAFKWGVMRCSSHKHTKFPVFSNRLIVIGFLNLARQLVYSGKQYSFYRLFTMKKTKIDEIANNVVTQASRNSFLNRFFVFFKTSKSHTAADKLFFYCKGELSQVKFISILTLMSLGNSINQFSLR